MSFRWEDWLIFCRIGKSTLPPPPRPSDKINHCAPWTQGVLTLTWYTYVPAFWGAIPINECWGPYPSLPQSINVGVLILPHPPINECWLSFTTLSMNAGVLILPYPNQSMLGSLPFSIPHKSMLGFLSYPTQGYPHQSMNAGVLILPYPHQSMLGSLPFSIPHKSMLRSLSFTTPINQ